MGAAVLGAVARPALGLPPPRRRRAVVASLAGTTVLASGLVLGTQIGLFPTMKPFRGVEAPASPTPAVTPRGAGHPVPKPPVSSLHSGAPSARGGDRASGSHSPSPSSSQTPTPGATVSAPSTSPALPAPSRPGELTPTPTPSPDELPSATPSQTPSAQPTPPADDQDSGVPEGDEGEADRGRDDRVPQTTASGIASSAPPTSDGNDNTENRTPVADMTGSASPTAEVGVDLGAVDLNVNVPDGDATAPTE